MKKYILIFSTSIILSLMVVVSCKDEFLDRPPLGAISEEAITNENGVNGALIVAYRALTGNQIAAWYTSASNWLWGSIRSDDAYKGSESLDQATEINPTERFEVLPSNPSVTNKWKAVYDAIGMANIVLRIVEKVPGLTETNKKNIIAEARFLRGFNHFEAKRNFNNVPYVDEKVTSTDQYKALTNEASIWPQIEADLKFAYDNLPPTQAQIGRVNKWAAGAYYAKALLYQNKYAEAKAVFDAIIANGVTSKGEKYGLQGDFKDVFRGDFENGKEVMFGIQYTVGDGTGGANSNKEGELTNPHNDGPGGCCGFHQPSQTLVNGFRTQAGLPLLYTSNAVNVKSQESNPNDYPDRGQLDTRLDYTVGRIGIPYKDFGPAKATWIRQLANGGPWLPNKHIQWKDEVGKYQIPGSWGQSQLGKTLLLLRYADLLLMAAECEVEVGSLTKAQEYVNMVRDRAVKSTKVMDGNQPAADYQVATYTAPWTDKTVARDAVRFERFLELAMEGHRFYDLVRWGVADVVINEFIKRESVARTSIAGVVFKKGKDEYLPIPEFAINQSKTSDGKQGLKQNPGY
ncbi:RagB/SusD family nutrient uptake outer membrane protein [Emticicia agri]|uniref:RagB/SusD family nutrient uptake outer membrane protein n=1 Tax=Emticicia agri TaxID=2492393 RepID=A0A4Q5LZN8_9BACT|nr:RagB/SusD family nutrient uptake outer membrane protein [Emticicia agri]RYU95391.1 RagB/SusD family nutrient uptake outer membrane protein [Emticicia agri]